jgi:DNA-binding response OmpR family regulator
MIMIVNKSRKDAQSLADMFHYMGLITLAATPSEALSKISISYHAVIIQEPNTLADKADYVQRLRSYINIPIFAMTKYEDDNDKTIFDGIISSGTYASRIYRYIEGYAKKQNIVSPGKYKLAGIDASVNLFFPMYFFTKLPFTKTELMILRTLMCAYPIPINAESILKYAFRPSKRPEVSNIRTHISIMNKKFREMQNRNVIILAPGKGYCILTPETYKYTLPDNEEAIKV